MSNLTAGTHIKVTRFGYTHHGIYVGKGQVIHFSGSSDGLASKATGQIEKTTLVAFKGNCKKPTAVLHTNACYSDEEVVRRAYSQLGKKDYNLIFNNCEHFATWCITGKKRSGQVNRAAAGATTAGTFAGVNIARTYASKKTAEALITQASKSILSEGGKRATASFVGQAASKTALHAGTSALAGTGATALTSAGVSSMASTAGFAAFAGKSAAAGGSLGGPVGLAVGVAVGVAAYGLWSLFDD